MESLEERVQDLSPTTAIATLVRDLDRERSVATDRRASYLSIRPMPAGAIAVYTHAQHVSIAVEPSKALELHDAMPYAEHLLKTPSTTYMVVKDEDLVVHFDAVLELALASVDWRAIAPSITLGSGAENKPIDEPDICPDCWYEVNPAGTCWC